MTQKYVIAVDLGGTNMRVALVDTHFQVVYKEYSYTQAFRTKDTLIAALLHSLDLIIKVRALKKENIVGIGIGLPGPIDVAQGVVHFFPNIPGWKEVKLKSILQEAVRLPVFLDNDANLMALAEHRLGAARGFANAVCLTLGTGVGGGIILNGELYRGSSFAAGELGHIPINEDGPRCNCGGVACLESYIGNKSIREQVRKLFRKHVPLEEVSVLAKHRDARAVQIWSDVGRRLGIALVGVVNFLNPDVIVIGGGVSNAGPILFKKVRETILRQAMAVHSRHVKVKKAQLGGDTGLIGAALLVKESLRSR
jgi:glucokinase